MKGITVAALFGATLLTGACSIREAQIRTPASLAAAERLEISGMGGGTRGSFRLAGLEGRFTRGAERLAVFDPLLVRNSGGGSFQLQQSAGTLEGSCGYRERELNVGPISARLQKFAYRCLFARDGRPIDAELTIAESGDSPGSMLMKRERRGTLLFDGRTYQLRSVHRDAGGGLEMATPLGYTIEHDGKAVAAVDLNGTNKTLFIAPGVDREAMFAAGLALSVLWDPATL